MSKIDRDWIIKCKNGEQMNKLWRVLKDAGEPVFRDTPNYIDEDTCIMRFLVNKAGWGNASATRHINMTFEEFMAIMKPEKENAQYVTNLLDYLDKPELIQHADGRQVKALHNFPKNSENSRILVVYSYGGTNTFSNEGFYTELDRVDENYNFVLKPKPKEFVTGWRRRVICENGSTFLDLTARPTKDEFMEHFKEVKCLKKYRFGPWEKVVTEVCDD